jgi:hypothetical protein
LAPDIAIIHISMPGLTGLEIRHRQQRESFHAWSFHRAHHLLTHARVAE